MKNMISARKGCQRLKVVFLLCGMLPTLSLAAAGDLTLTFKVTPVAPTCELTGPATVITPTSSVGDFPGSGSTNLSEKFSAKFSLKLNNCTGIGKPQIQVWGDKIGLNANSKKFLWRTSGTANNVGVIFKFNGTTYSSAKFIDSTTATSQATALNIDVPGALATTNPGGIEVPIFALLSNSGFTGAPTTSGSVTANMHFAVAFP